MIITADSKCWSCLNACREINKNMEYIATCMHEGTCIHSKKVIDYYKEDEYKISIAPEVNLLGKEVYFFRNNIYKLEMLAYGPFISMLFGVSGWVYRIEYEKYGYTKPVSWVTDKIFITKEYAIKYYKEHERARLNTIIDHSKENIKELENIIASCRKQKEELEEL